MRDGQGYEWLYVEGVKAGYTGRCEGGLSEACVHLAYLLLDLTLWGQVIIVVSRS